MANLGVNYKDAGRLDEAMPLLEEAYRAGRNTPTLRWVATPLLDAYAKAGENAKLANLLQEQLLEARKALPKDSPQLAGTCSPRSARASWSRKNGPTPNRSCASAWPSAKRRSPTLEHVQHQVDARRRTPGPEEIRRTPNRCCWPVMKG